MIVRLQWKPLQLFLWEIYARGEEKMKIGDCRLNAVSYLLEKKNIYFSPAMCLGIGEGYDFSFWVEKSGRFPSIVMMGRTSNCEEILLQNLSIRYEKFGNPSCNQEKNDSELQQILKQGHYALIYLDRYYLKYLENKFGRSHCGFHSVVLWDIDNSDLWGIHDALALDESVVAKLSIVEGRASKTQPFPSKYEGLYISEIADYTKLSDMDSLIYHAILNNMKRYSESYNSGLKALDSFSNQLKSLTALYLKYGHGDSLLRSQMILFFNYIHDFEDSHSFYRKLYAEFLEEAEIRFGCELESINEEFYKIGDEWIRISCLLNSTCQGNLSNVLNELAMMLERVVVEEKEAVDNLTDIVSKKI